MAQVTQKAINNLFSGSLLEIVCQIQAIDRPTQIWQISVTKMKPNIILVG